MAARFAMLGNRDAAIHEQERAAALSPALAEAQVELARLLSDRGRPDDLSRAEAVLREAGRQSPNRAIVPFMLGVVLVRQGRTEEARAAWIQALAIDPSFEPARARLRAAGLNPAAPAPGAPR